MGPHPEAPSLIQRGDGMAQSRQEDEARTERRRGSSDAQVGEEQRRRPEEADDHAQ